MDKIITKNNITKIENLKKGGKKLFSVMASLT